ncbi:hypothetical protein ACN9MU_16535 [Pseudoduganella sp. R-32]|uniref:hypothetical protein n=1 Tax=Pseudoduganella sp. R-32 TaxID=3404061 RepID=UPI003CEAF0FC
MKEHTELTPREARILAASRGMTEWARAELLRYTLLLLREYPYQPAKPPKLRLIQGGSHNNCREVRNKGREITV